MGATEGFFVCVLFCFIEVKLTYNIVLVSDVHDSGFAYLAEQSPQ